MLLHEKLGSFDRGFKHYSSETVAGKELSLSSRCIASLYFYHFSTVIDFSSEKYSGPT